MASSTSCLGCGILFTVLALGFLAISFSTDNWVQVTVDTKTLVGILADADYVKNRNEKWWYHTRNRGLFKRCFPGNETKFLDQATDKVDNYCTYLQYELPETDTYETKSDDYKTMIHLMRSQMAFTILAMVFYVIAFVTGAFGCMRSRISLARTSAILVFVGALCAAAGMAFFHGAEYLEKSKVKDGDYFPSNWPTSLTNNVKRGYKWSYIMAWLNVGLAIIGAILFLVCAFVVREKERDEKVPLDERLSHAPSRLGKAHYGDYYDQGYDDYYNRGMHGGPYGAAPYEMAPAEPHMAGRTPRDYYYDNYRY